MPRIIALTGATGFIGTAVIGRLLSAGFQVRALYRKTNTAKRVQDKSVNWVPGRLEVLSSLGRLLTGAEAVIHCAGCVRGAEWRQFKQVNTDGVARMVRAIKKMHPSPRFLLLSSLAAREPRLSYYAASKRQGEEILKNAGGNLEWTILRPPAVYGPGDREIAPLLRLMRKGFAPQASSESAKFSMIYVDDLAAAIIAVIAQKVWPQSILELHDGRPDGYDWREVVQTVSRVVARPVYRVKVPYLLIRSAAVINVWASRIMGWAPMLSPGKVRELGHEDWTCDNEAIIRETGWRPSTSLEEGMRKTLVYLGCIPDQMTRHAKGPRHADV
ncbi:MAG: NAD-dependent epimerase/dehydratase family protein [Desulfosarcina sp.]|nr:NAD-dependent epimerase/dehydratase family protein [Desulfobacterales bacterium]